MGVKIGDLWGGWVSIDVSVVVLPILITDVVLKAFPVSIFNAVGFSAAKDSDGPWGDLEMDGEVVWGSEATLGYCKI